MAPETPGSVHEGGELGYALSHAYGAAFDHPGLLVACVIGDGEAETGPLAASWHSNKFLDPVHDGAVLPILHLNGYKIANPTVLSRIPEAELDALLRGYGHDPLYVTGSDPAQVHPAMARALDHALDRISLIQQEARKAGTDPGREYARWPMIVLRTPKGWTGPATVDGDPVEGTWRAHQVPLAGVRENPAHLKQLEDWLRSYRPEELFDADGRPTARVLACVPEGERRLGAVPYANGGRLLRPLPLPTLDAHAVPVDKPGRTLHEPTRVLGQFLTQVMRETAGRRDFRVVGPDETASNRLDDLYQATGKAWQGITEATDRNLARDGRVMEILSEHVCQGWLEGYLLTGRHGLFSTYEAFAHIVDSMVGQHIKWLKTSRELSWRAPIASLNYLLTSHVWRQDNNGFSHQDPGFVDHVLNKSPEVVRVYLPPDANTLLAVADHALRSRDQVNVIVAGKQPCFDWLPIEEARTHVARGAGVWEWAGTDHGSGSGSGSREPDVVLACAGDVPTMEVLAAAALLREHLPSLAVRVVNVVDIARLMPHDEHPHGMTKAEYDALFTTDRPVISPTTATRGSSTASPTAGPATPSCTSAATRSPAPRRPRSTWSCATTWTATGSSWTSSTAFPASRAAPRACARPWPTSASATTTGSASTAPTCRRWRTGPGRTEHAPRCGPCPSRPAPCPECSRRTSGQGAPYGRRPSESAQALRVPGST